MSENKLSYLSRNYNDVRQGILQLTKIYYPDVFANLDDASIGAWLVDMLSDVSDTLNYHIDQTVQETSLDSASQFSSIQDMARTNGLKIPYKKAALVEVELSCNLPLYTQGNTGDGDMMADERYCPYIKRGTQFSTGGQTFELTADMDFREQFDENGNSNRQIIPNRNSNGNVVSYTYKKLGIASASQTKVMKQVITAQDIKPFMEVIVNDSDVIGVESIIVKQGTNINSDPQINEFFVDKEVFFDRRGILVKRFFEVDNLIEQYRFGYKIQETEEGLAIGDETIENSKYTNYYNPVWEISEKMSGVYDEEGNEIVVPLRLVTKGQWKPLKQKYTTEYTDGWQMKITFGAGIENSYGTIPVNAKDFTKYQMSRMTANDYLGVLPEAGSTMYVLYRVGGGEISNIATGTLTNIVGLNLEIEGNCDDDNNSEKIRRVRSSITVTNTTPSYGGKDEPTAEEIKHLIKYNAASQNRCVTLKDYQAKIEQIPAKFGCPFRCGIIEENNKVVIYTLGLDYEGHLNNFLAETVAENIKEYLSNFKMLNDFVEIKSGRIINLAFRLIVYIDKTYDKSEVTKRIIDMVYDYMDVRRHMMGEDIYVGDLQKEISKLDGVDNLVSLKVFNKIGVGYSDDSTTQQLANRSDCTNFDNYEDFSDEETDENEIDLSKSDYTLFSENDSMFEIKYKNKDIKVEVRVRN